MKLQNSKLGGGNQYLIDKKGFTLIELLGVIVILAVIAVIGSPIIVGLIESTKKEAYKRTAEGLMEGAQSVLIKQTINGEMRDEIVFDFSNPEDNNVKSLQVTGEFPESGTMMITKDGTTSIVINNGKYCARKFYNEEKVTITEYNAETCKDFYRESVLKGNYPVLDKGMTPIYYDGVTAKVADIVDEWYSYENSIWANAVILKENPSKDYSVKGTVVDESDVLAYFVWIPRYEYTIKGSFGVNGTSNSELGYIDIKFSNLSEKTEGTATYTGDTPSNYLTHTAFTFGGKELRGIWVGKFETTGSASNPTIKPSIQSLRSQNVSTQFETALKFRNYGLESESRMMKNDEWGAVAYLSQSIYGRCPETGTCPELMRNNNSSLLTGYAAVNAATTGYINPSSSANEYGTDASITQPYNTVAGYKASTTGNITGIYDMSGGSWEYVMGVLADENGNPYSGRHNVYNSGYNGKFGRPDLATEATNGDTSILELTTGKNLPESKYYNLYTTTNRDTACNGGKCLGHANSETPVWYGDYAGMLSAASPWIHRGGYFYHGSGAGLFSFNAGYGSASSYNSFRVVVLP